MHAAAPAESVYLDLSGRTKLRLTGADRVRFLNGQVSNDVRQISPATSLYTGVMTIKGKLCADAYVHAWDDALLLDADDSVRESLAARLERYIIADDVQIKDVTETLGLFHLLDFGATPPASHLAAVRQALEPLRPALQVVASTRFGAPGMDIFFAPDLDEKIRHQLHSSFTELNDDAAESWRILAGVPRWGAELDENVMPAEAGIESRAVSFTKGCYIGQEIVSRVKSVGHVNRHLCGLHALDASPLYPGMLLTLPEEKDAAKPIGRITSAAPSAGHGGANYVALGYVRRGSEAPRTILAAWLPAENVAGSESELAVAACRVEVCALPFVKAS